MSIEKLNEIKIRIEEKLGRYFDERIKESGSGNLKEALEFLRDFTLRGGKRIRAGMLCYGYSCYKKLDEEVMKAAMAMELIQSYLLIHDDIIDKDELRRGKDSMHVMYEKKGLGRDAKHYGISQAICVGDLACVLAYEILESLNFKDEIKIKTIKKVNDILKKVVEGQVLDIYNETQAGLKEKDILEVYRLKSASYTVEGPLEVGAILAGETGEIFCEYGINLGKAFQIRDDINGMFGDETKTGKSNDSDLKEGKKTLLIIKTLENCNKEERKFLLSCLGNKNISKEDVERVRKLMKEKGALDYCLKLSSKLVEEARESIKNKELREEGKKFLLKIADYIANREN